MTEDIAMAMVNVIKEQQQNKRDLRATTLRNTRSRSRTKSRDISGNFHEI